MPARYAHGCAGEGLTRFLPEQLEFYASRSETDRFRSRGCAGIYLEFITDAPEISFQYDVEGACTARSGFDLYEDGVLRMNCPLAPVGSKNNAVVYRREAKGPSKIRIKLTNSGVIAVHDLSFGDAQPTPKKEKTVLFYGDSITQSAFIPRPSLSWTGIVAEALGAEEINRGVGSFFFEEKSLPASDSLQPDLIFVEYGVNDLSLFPGLEENLHRAERYFARLKQVYPGVKVYAVTPDFCNPMGLTEAINVRMEDYCKGLTEICRNAGVEVISGKELLPHDPALACDDHLHLNEAGSALFAENLLKFVRKAGDLE